MKSAKKSIFALHRGNMKQARSEITKASTCACQIKKEFLEAQPSLRNGSYGNSVEEWAEARLFEYWLLWATSSDDEKKTRTPFLLHSEICKEIEMTEDEYLGGLIDLTGEIGRWAVARAAQRDSDSVERALASCRKIQEAVLALGGAAPHRVRRYRIYATSLLIIYVYDIITSNKFNRYERNCRISNEIPKRCKKFCTNSHWYVHLEDVR